MSAISRYTDVVERLRRWADSRDLRNPGGHGRAGTALLREAATEIERLRGSNSRQENA